MSSTRRIVRSGLLLSVLLSPTTASGQAGVSLSGRVTDEQNAVLVGASVTVRSATTSFGGETTTDGTGAFRLVALPPGELFLTVALPGFRTHTQALTLGAGDTHEVDVLLVLSPFAQRVDIVALSPAPGGGVDRTKLPTTIATLDADALMERHASSLADSLSERLGMVTLEGATSNPFQPTLRFRGFTASPVLGLPQGVAVYQNGVRINEPFGDTVQFDLIPQFALAHVQLSAGAESVFGLNALGSALSLRLKNGFDAPGFVGNVSGGSFERVQGSAEYGAHRGAWGVYAGLTRFSEAGWRKESESDVTQAVVDVSYRTGARVDAGGTFTFADTRLNGNGPAPVELLAVDRRAVFTFPDTTRNRMAFGEGRLHVALTPSWSLQFAGFYRDLDRLTLNGDEAELGVCDALSRPQGAPANALCARAADEDESRGVAVVDASSGRFITGDDAMGDGAINRTSTGSRGYGGSFQAISSTPLSRLAGRENVFVVGVSADFADVSFASNSEVGTLTRERTINGSGLFAGVFMEAPDDRFNTDLTTENRSIGVYASDTLSLTERLHVTASARYNDTRLDIRDQLGTSLDGEHRFARVNPGVGAVYETSDAVQIFARYSESSRAPTAAELSCADPNEPCRVPNAFVSDPPLDQVVARSFEGGVRGTTARDGSPPTLRWSATAYRTSIRDDILFVSSPVLIGTGFFQNAGDTRRAGLDAELSGQLVRTRWYASYGLVEATFESPLVLPSSSDVNDEATDDGEIEVEPGDRMPGVPRHSLKAGVRHGLTEQWDMSFEGVFASSRFFLGDEGNDQEPLDGYGVFNFRTSYILREHVELFARVDNVFDADYATFGVLAEVELDLEEAPGADDPRFVSPGAPRSAFVGVRIRF